MAHYAQVIDSKVVQVIVAEQNFINMISNSTEGEWIQTSYNTSGGEHVLGGTPLRKNFASSGYSYDKDLDAFIPPKLFNSWVLNYNTCLWESPIPMPEDNKNYNWDESSLNWIELV